MTRQLMSGAGEDGRVRTCRVHLEDDPSEAPMLGGVGLSSAEYVLTTTTTQPTPLAECSGVHNGATSLSAIISQAHSMHHRKLVWWTGDAYLLHQARLLLNQVVERHNLVFRTDHGIVCEERVAVFLL
eukprot:CAMPEP_0119529332 /NCGR_PEP_ID=MMETSP1344-20130328/43358_1 /TAXON_ID=236787 /ORGANISM="Florenciella parvula, Strain CCMP2471" /LENGTH=127 /DNA_ID=CAMNT_0007568935 /DNA_START=425 /DNA_END=806 /DNA_ORIENTATION=+